MGINASSLTAIVGAAVYCCQALVALWGAYCAVTVWQRIAQLRFRGEAEQDALLDAVEADLLQGDGRQALELCVDDRRALPQLAAAAIENRDLPYDKVRQLVANRFQRDVMADVEQRLSWINTMIRSSPMLGLFGTVIGMMGAFAQFGGSEQVEATSLAADIYVALITTAVGLAIAIPLILAVAAINVRLRDMEELSLIGLGRFFEALKASQASGGRPASR